jgi:glycosyltransferase involved in cell wall biosynthesis
VISFIVPCYNYARFLPECVESILKLDGDFEWELVLIDDASTDNTQEVIRSFSDPRMRVIAHPVNFGHARTMNEGLRAARGEFIARIDPDDRYRPSFLTAVMGKFEAFPEVGLVYGDVALINERGQITVERCDREHGGRDFKGNELVRLLERNFICAPSVIARREAWLRVAPVPQQLAFNDWYFTVMMARAHEFYYVDEVVAEYRLHGANHHSMIARDKAEEASIVWVLDRVFGSAESNPEIERAKREARGRIYGAQYLEMADKYFGCSHERDARRCYLSALRHRPAFLGHSGLLRRLAATCIGRRWYQRLKSVARNILGRLA